MANASNNCNSTAIANVPVVGSTTSPRVTGTSTPQLQSLVGSLGELGVAAVQQCFQLLCETLKHPEKKKIPSDYIAVYLLFYLGILTFFLGRLSAQRPKWPVLQKLSDRTKHCFRAYPWSLAASVPDLLLLQSPTDSSLYQSPIQRRCSGSWVGVRQI